MPSRPIRAAGHLGAVVLLSGVALVVTSAVGSAAAPSRPDSYGGDATASAAHVSVDRNPGLFPAVQNAINDDLPYANTSIDSSGGATATAAPFTPGQGVLGVPALICVFAGPVCQKVTPPDYPFMAFAQYPSNKDSKATVSAGTIKQGPAQVTPGETVAHADPNLVEASTVAQGAGVSNVMSAGNATAHSLQHFVGSTLVVTTESALTGVDIAKVLHIDSIRSTATAKVDGGKVSAATATTTISGATLAGTPVTIDSHGIHAAGHGDGNAVSKQVNSALKALAKAGISARQLGVTHKSRKGAAMAQTGGLLVTFKHTVNVANPVPPIPRVPAPPNPSGDYFGTITLAGAGADAFASPASPPVTVGPVAVPRAAGGAPAAATRAGGAPPPPQSPTTATAPTNGTTPDVAGAAPAPASKPAALDLTWKRMRTLALVLLAYPLLVLIGRPLRAPSRLPQSS